MLANCYKCGHLSHWSHDCSSNPAAASTENPNPNHHPSVSRFAPYLRSRFTKTAAAVKGEDGSGEQAQNKKKERAKRPKFTLDLLLSDDSLASCSATSPRPSNPTLALATRRTLGRFIKRMMGDADHRKSMLHVCVSASVTQAAKLNEKIEKMFRGDKINNTENRSVLHVSLSVSRDTQINSDTG
ncbi:hypothetical protein ABZP36_007653 [Zizania latifolia]